VFGTDVDVGKGVADLLVKYLVREGSYAVIERRALEAVLAEQNFSTSRRGDPASAARIGKMLGVDAIILGSITQFGGDRQEKNRGGIGGTIDAVGGGVRRDDETKAIVTLDARIVDVDSGEILAIADGTGESSRTGKSAGGFILSKGFFGFGGIDIASSKFQETIIGEAVKRAVEQMSVGVIAARPRLAARTVDVEVLVAFADGSNVILNAGRKAGLQPGSRLMVERVTQEIHDPVSGNVVRRLTEPIGEIEVTEADDTSAMCRMVSGAGIKVGDAARNRIGFGSPLSTHPR
jgi:curli biogenesis system outer membrane secretion channel CsgG